MKIILNINKAKDEIFDNNTFKSLTNQQSSMNSSSQCILDTVLPGKILNKFENS
jgi:hypothetical protein